MNVRRASNRFTALTKAARSDRDRSHSGTVSELSFSYREQQIMELLARGLADKEIMVTLGMSLGTLRTHMSRLFVKTGQKRRTGLVATYVRLGSAQQEHGS